MLLSGTNSINLYCLTISLHKKKNTHTKEYIYIRNEITHHVRSTWMLGIVSIGNRGVTRSSF